MIPLIKRNELQLDTDYNDKILDFPAANDVIVSSDHCLRALDHCLEVTQFSFIALLYPINEGMPDCCSLFFLKVRET